jgi:hypothetical protein
MPTPIDLKPNEELVRKRISLSKQTYDLAMKDAQKYAGGGLSMWLRMLIRKHHGIKERNID